MIIQLIVCEIHPRVRRHMITARYSSEFHKLKLTPDDRILCYSKIYEDNHDKTNIYRLMSAQFVLMCSDISDFCIILPPGEE